MSTTTVTTEEAGEKKKGNQTAPRNGGSGKIKKKSMTCGRRSTAQRTNRVGFYALWLYLVGVAKRELSREEFVLVYVFVVCCGNKRATVVSGYR